ncbi:MAG: hypothetical protein JW828_10510 [Sedimentisphaerales bacterium]|nr:hypothetical protein [Sedimentisphaerales bacterium]
MDISIFVIRAAFLALPGLVASKLYRKGRGYTTKKNWEDFVEILIFSLLSYLLLGILFSVVRWFGILNSSACISFFKALQDDNIPLNWWKIALATIFGAFLAIIASYFHRYKAITWIMRLIHASNRIADEELWELFHSSTCAQWLYVRDHKLDLVYFGCITKYSDSDNDRELVMEDVSVYNNKGDFLYDCPVLYFSRDKYDLSIELLNFALETPER